ncbi:hypothetical protein ACJX0J_035281, partial [Zea mays]
MVEEVRAEAVTNEQLVEEAWEVVNESFLPDAASRPWSPEMWMQRKQDVLQGTIKSRARAHDIIRKMLASLGDPYTRFLSPSEFSKMSKYDMTGIGLNLREIPDENGSFKLMVLGLLLDGPAYSAGVRQGDELLSVNGIDVKGKSAFDASSMLQGPKETFVTIKVKHGDCGPVESMKVQRQLVTRTPVFYRLEKRENNDSSVGYIHITEFNAVAKKDLVSALKRLQKSGASYFVLDLRDNLGGLVQAGIETAKLFLNKGDTVIYTAGRDRLVQKAIVAESGPMIATPLMLLVNNRTASASEIVASALHDNCKAVLVGERTFGKGLIQSLANTFSHGKKLLFTNKAEILYGFTPASESLHAFWYFLQTCKAGSKRKGKLPKAKITPRQRAAQQICLYGKVLEIFHTTYDSVNTKIWVLKLLVAIIYNINALLELLLDSDSLVV